MAAVSAAASRPLGNQQEQLIGVDAFNPSSRKGQKTVVKGVFIEDAGGTRINVTSLQTAADKCPAASAVLTHLRGFCIATGPFLE
jgi:hypothetical protein